jgi:hypothetical protein
MWRTLPPGGEVLRYAVAYALRRSRKIVRGLKEGLTERSALPSPITRSRS